MNPIKILKTEHEEIEMELMELDEVMATEIVNYTMLLHSFKKLCSLWDPHEKREEKLFAVMTKEKVKIPVHTITSEHGELREHIEKIKGAINSGSDYEVRKSFDNDLKVILCKIRAHMAIEDEILYTIASNEFTEKGLEEMRKIVTEK